MLGECSANALMVLSFCCGFLSPPRRATDCLPFTKGRGRPGAKPRSAESSTENAMGWGGATSLVLRRMIDGSFTHSSTVEKNFISQVSTRTTKHSVFVPFPFSFQPHTICLTMLSQLAQPLILLRTAAPLARTIDSVLMGSNPRPSIACQTVPVSTALLTVAHTILCATHSAYNAPP